MLPRFFEKREPLHFLEFIVCLHLFSVDRASVLELIWAIFQVLTAAMQDEPINKVIFMDEVRIPHC